jgi:hypothetical protein
VQRDATKSHLLITSRERSEYMKRYARMGFLRTLMILTILSVVCGCASTCRTKMYPGPELSKQEIAILKGGTELDVRAVDGVAKKYTPRVFKGPIAGHRGFEIHLLPGVHTVQVGLHGMETDYRKQQTVSYWSKQDKIISFKAIAGHVYWISSGRAGFDDWHPGVVDITQWADEIDISKDAYAYNNRGVAYAKKGQYDQAISAYNKVLEINPRDALAYYGRARSYYFKKEYDKSWDDIKKAQDLGYKVPPEFLDDLRKASARQN